MLTRKKAIAFFLILIMVLLTGCSGNSLYPKDKTVMKKLFEDNADEFHKFADNLLLQVKDGELLDIVYAPKANLGGVYGYTISKGTNASALESISKLQNGKEISDFFAKYSVFSAMAGGGSGDVTFDIFPIHLAETSGSGSGYKPEHMKDIRQYSFLPNATEEQVSGMLARGIIEIEEHWYAGIPGLDIQKPITDGFIDSIITKMSSEGFKVIEPTLKSITLPFLSGRDKTSNVNNYDADYIFEIDEATLVFFYEREEKVSATLFNWETEEILEMYIFPDEASQSGIYHVERLSLDLFAYSAANVSVEPQLVNILKITSEEIEEVGILTLPSDVRFTVCSAGISPDMKHIVMARSAPARLTLAELDNSLVIHETDELNAATLRIGDRATLDNVKFISEDVVAYSWMANNADDETRYSGIGLYSITERKILLDYPVSNKGIVSSGNKIFTVDNASSSTVEKSDSIRVLDETETLSLGAWYFSSGYQNIYPSYLGDYFFIRIFGHRSTQTPFYFARYSLEDQAWNKEVWMVPDPVTYHNSPPKTRSIDFVTASSFQNRFYMLALDGQKPVLNVVQHPNP